MFKWKENILEMKKMCSIEYIASVRQEKIVSNIDATYKMHFPPPSLN